MATPAFLKPTPWDSAVYGVETFELLAVTEAALEYAARNPGHYTAKVDPLSSKRLLHDFGFYYCDSLLEPHCSPADLVRFDRDDITVSRDVAFERLLEICHGAFAHDRFHRDFNLRPALADERLDRWLRQLHEAGDLYGVLLAGEPAAIIGLAANRLVLHAVAPPHRGQGLARYMWSAACRRFFAEHGFETLVSSISAANLAAVNLYASLGFTFGACVDAYHGFTTEASAQAKNHASRA